MSFFKELCWVIWELPGTVIGLPLVLVGYFFAEIGEKAVLAGAWLMGHEVEHE